MCESVYKATVPILAESHMSFESAITIILTALAVMLAIMAIVLGVAAIWGYSGIRDTVKDIATKKVDDAMLLKLKEYPAAAEILDLLQRLKTGVEFMDQMQGQIILSPAPNTVENASKYAIKGDVPTVFPVGQEPIAEAEPYPGEDKPNASSSGANPDKNTAPDRPDNPRPDHS
jgi:hypothetical protein